MLLFESGARSCGLFPFLLAGLPAGAPRLRCCVAGTRSIPRDVLWPKTHRWDGYEGTELWVPLTGCPNWNISGSVLPWKMILLAKSIFPAIQVYVECVYHPFLFQNNLPIKVIHTFYLIEGNGRTSPRQHTHRLSLIAIVSCVLLVIK